MKTNLLFKIANGEWIPTLSELIASGYSAVIRHYDWYTLEEEIYKSLRKKKKKLDQERQKTKSWPRKTENKILTNETKKTRSRPRKKAGFKILLFFYKFPPQNHNS